MSSEIHTDRHTRLSDPSAKDEMKTQAWHRAKKVRTGSPAGKTINLYYA